MRSYLRQLSVAQQKFLRGIRDGSPVLAELKKTRKIEDSQLSRWVRNKWFRAELRRAINEVRERMKLEAGLAGLVAAKALANTLRPGEKSPTESRIVAWRTAIELGEKLTRPRRRGKKNPPRRARAELCHPNMKHRQKEYLERMIARRKAAEAQTVAAPASEVASSSPGTPGEE